MSIFNYKIDSDPKNNPFIYPAANRNDGGADNSEQNLSLITSKFTTRNFSLREPEGQEYFKVTVTNNVLIVSPGKCCIAGRYIDIPVTAKLEIDTDTVPLYVSLNLILDGSGLVRGDTVTIDESSSTPYRICAGLTLNVDTEDEYKSRNSDTKLDLATITKDSSGNIVITRNPMIYSYIDTDNMTDSSGVPIKDWTIQTISNIVDKLNELNYYNNDVKVWTLKLSGVSDSPKLQVLDSNGKEIYNITDIDNRTHPSEEGGSNDYGENGNSLEIARMNHSHDKRYIINKDNESTESQSVYQLSINNLSFDRASTSNGTAQVDSTGNIETQGYLTVGTPQVSGIKSGDIKASGTIIASKVYNAVWNDYAEAYYKDNPDENVLPGTVISKVKGKNTYAPTIDDNRNLVVGVVSDSYGHLIGGDADKSLEDNLKYYYPIALAGRVYVRVVKGAIINEGDLIFASSSRGLASAYSKATPGTIIGKSLESSDGTKDKVLIQVMLR